MLTMYLFFFILALATVASLPDITQHEGALFQDQGYLIGGLSWAHITVPINVSRMEQDVNGYRQLIDYFDALSTPVPGPGNRGQLSDEERRRMLVLKKICGRRLEKMNEVISDQRANLGNDVNTNWKTTKSTRSDAASPLVPSSDPIVRERRQVAIGLAAIGGMIVGAITRSLFSQYKTNALVDILDRKVDTVVHQVDHIFRGINLVPVNGCFS